MHPCCVFLLVFCGQVPEKPLPNCGETAAYCYLRAMGVDVPLSTCGAPSIRTRLTFFTLHENNVR